MNPKPVACLRHFLAIALAITATMSVAVAQKPPGLGYVYPPVVRAGESAAVDLGGYDFTIDMQWFPHDDRVQLQHSGPPGDYLVPPPPFWFGPRTSLPAMPIPREVAGTITVPADMPEGLVRWQVANANGASETAVFHVSRGHEITEHRSRDLPQRLDTLPVAVSGRLSRLTEVDRYELQVDQDQLVTVDLMARRLGSDFNGVLQVRNAAGTLIADFVDTSGIDGRLSFMANAGTLYTVSVNDLDFRGDRAYVYRLALSTGPRVLGMLPAMAQRGTSVPLEFFGIGLTSGTNVLESVRETVAITGESTQSTQTHLLKTPAGEIPVEIPLSSLSETVRTEAEATTTSQAQPASGPGAVTGRFTGASQTHSYSWPVMMGERWALEVQARALLSDVDVALEVLDGEGKPVADNDDGLVNSDATLQFQAATSGIFTAVVRAMSVSENAANTTYRLQLLRETPDFSLSVPQIVSLPLGGKAEVNIKASRMGGFDGDIVLKAASLPEGVTATGDWIIPAGKAEAKVTLESAKDAAVVATAIRILGTSMIEGTEVSRTALAPAAGVLNPLRAADRDIPQVLLAMTMPAPIEVLVVDKERQRDVHRGTTYLAELDLERKDGFTGEIRIEMTARQDRQRMGTRGPVLTVPAGENKAWYPVFLPEWLPTDLTRRIIVHGVVAVPDPKGTIRYLTKPGNARITMIMEGALLKLTAANNDSVNRIGSVIEIPVTISRSPKLPLPVTVSLNVPDEAQGFLKAEPVTLAADQNTGVLRIETQADDKLVGEWSLTLTATALQDNQWPVVSQTDIRVEFVVP
jgi:type 1 fimbria pilin